MVAIGGAVLACNQIVGVEDVRLRGTGSRPDTGSSGSDPEPDPEPDPGPDPEPEPGTDAGTGCGDNLACTRYVFLTSAVFDGNLNGLAGADAKCLVAAQKNPVLAKRVFHAWLSDATKNVSDPTRFHKGTRPYIRVDGTNFAASFSQIATSALVSTLNIDENGNAQTGPVGSPALSVWTATSSSPGNAYNGFSCNNWTTAATTAAGAFGDSGSKTGTWTEQFVDSEVASSLCTSQKHLYCIEF